MHQEINRLLSRLKRECPNCYHSAEAAILQELGSVMKKHTEHHLLHKLRHR